MASRDIDNADLSALRIERQAGTPRKRSRKALFLAIFAFLCVALVAYGLLAKRESGTAVQIAEIKVYDPNQGSSVLTASGYVVAQTQAAIASKGMGRIETLSVEEGDAVVKGQIIAELEHDDVDAALEKAQANLLMTQAQYEEAQANLTEAELDHNRQAELHRRSLISKAEFDLSDARLKRAVAGVASADASIEVARAAVAEANVQVENTRIRAPFDGTVLTKNADIGEIVAPLAGSANSRSAVVTIADMNSLEVEADVSESNIQRVTAGQACEIILDAFPSIRYPGYVHKIVPTADRAKATVLTKVRFSNRDNRVLPEMSAKINFLSSDTQVTGDSSQAILVCPRDAVVRRNEKDLVFVVRNNRVSETPVVLGKSLGSLWEVTAGLSIGMRVVVNPPDGLQSGAEVTMMP